MFPDSFRILTVSVALKAVAEAQLFITLSLSVVLRFSEEQLDTDALVVEPDEAGQAERPAVVSPNMSSSPPGKHQFIHVPPSTTLVKKLKFIHVTKTGGTSIEALGVSMNVSWGKHDRDYGKLKSHHLIVERKNPDLLEQYDWFLVVRNPFARIVSEFWCKWGGKGRPANPTPASFNAFLRNRMSNVQSATATTRGHYVPMWRYYTPYPKVVIRVARFETLERDLRAIFGLYNLTMPTSLPHVYATPHPLSVQHLDQQTLAMIRRVYATDFEIFRYSLDERLAFSPDRAHWGRPGHLAQIEPTGDGRGKVGSVGGAPAPPRPARSAARTASTRRGSPRSRRAAVGPRRRPL